MASRRCCHATGPWLTWGIASTHPSQGKACDVWWFPLKVRPKYRHQNTSLFKRNQKRVPPMLGNPNPYVAIQAQRPRIHHRVLMPHHSPSVQHIGDCGASLDDLEDLALNHNHGVQEAATVCCPWQAKHKGSMQHSKAILY